MTDPHNSGIIPTVAAETQKQWGSERYRQSGNHPDDPGTESKKDEKKYLTNPKDFDKISELLRKRQSNTVWYDLRNSKELRKKFKKVLDKHKEMC